VIVHDHAETPSTLALKQPSTIAEIRRLMFDFLRQELPERAACKLMVALLSLAHDRACEAQLAGVLAEDLEQRRLPDITALLGRFAPDPARLPEVCVQLAPLSSYDVLMEAALEVDA